MTPESDCLHCGATLPVGANYCPECGRPSPFGVLDPLDVERELVAAEPPLRSRSGWVLGVVVVVGIAVLGWSLTRGGDANAEDPLDPQIAEDGPEAADSAVSPTATGAAPAESTASTLATEQRFVNDVAGPVLGADVHGGLVLLAGAKMRRVDLSTGAVTEIDLDHSLRSRVREQSVVVGSELVAFSLLPGVLAVTDLRTGSQRLAPLEPEVVDEPHIAGAAGPDAVWLEYQGVDGSSVVEVDLSGEVRRRTELPPEFSVQWAQGDELFLSSVDGSWLYDASTDEVTRLAGEFVEDRSPLLIRVSCESSLECRVEADLGDGMTPVDGIRASEMTSGSAFMAPDLPAILVHYYDSNTFTYLDLLSGTRIELGEISIDPYGGVVWIPDSPWIVGLSSRAVPRAVTALTAVNVQTAEQLELDIAARTVSVFNTVLVPAPPA